MALPDKVPPQRENTRMIYTVECAFTDPARENAWNAYYDAEKLEALLSVPGFRASQRFRAITDTPAPYLAIHSIRDAAVLKQKDYGNVGGGAFGGWDKLVTNWDRNLFTGMEAAPEVSIEQFLVILDDPAVSDEAAGAEFIWLDVAGLDKTVPRRGFAVVDQEFGAALVREKAGVVKVFEPITDRRVSRRGLDN